METESRTISTRNMHPRYFCCGWCTSRGHEPGSISRWWRLHGDKVCPWIFSWKLRIWAANIPETSNLLGFYKSTSAINVLKPVILGYILERARLAELPFVVTLLPIPIWQSIIKKQAMRLSFQRNPTKDGFGAMNMKKLGGISFLQLSIFRMLLFCHPSSIPRFIW